jgi:hypothetical protein
VGEPLILETSFLIGFERELRRRAPGPAHRLLEDRADDRFHITAKDGAVRSFDYGKGGPFWTSSGDGDIDVPEGHIFPWDGNHENQDYHQPIKWVRWRVAGGGWGYFRDSSEY